MPSGNGQPRTYSVASDTASAAFDSDKLILEIEADAGVTTALRTPANGGAVASVADVLEAHFVGVLSGAELTALDAVVAAHDGIAVRELVAVIVDPHMNPVEPGASDVLANDRPAIEVVDGNTGFMALSGVWPLPVYSIAKLKASVKFILKTAGTGTKVRIGGKIKSEAIGDDSSISFSVTGFSVITITHTTVGEVFEGLIELDASTFKLDDSVAIQLGRDGNNEMGAGTNDDVNVPIQIISVKIEAQ